MFSIIPARCDWCFNEGHPYADPILEKLEAGDMATVPAMWLYEASAVLAQAQLRSIITSEKAVGFVDELLALNIQPDPENTARVFPETHRSALPYRLTSYDAAYLEPAIRRGLALATLHDDLRKAAAGVALL